MNNPEILIKVEGGAVTSVSFHVPGCKALVYDQDAGKETHVSEVEVTCPDGFDLSQFAPLAKGEIDAYRHQLGLERDSSTRLIEALLQVISETPAAAAAFRKRMSSSEGGGDEPEIDTDNVRDLRLEPQQNLNKEFTHPLKIGFDIFADDETDPHERVLTFQNGLPVSRPFSDYRGGKIRITQLPDNRIEVELYGLSEGVSVYVPEKAMPLTPPVEAFWVRATGGALPVLNDHVASFVDYSWLHSGVVDLAEGVAQALGHTLQWVEDIDDLAEELAQLSAESGLFEREVLQQLLKDGRLKWRS